MSALPRLLPATTTQGRHLFKSFGLCGYVNLTLEVPSLNMNVKDQEMDEETVPDMGIPGEHQHH